MPNAQETQAMTILYAACSAMLGIVVKTTNPTRARQLFYATRNELGDPTLNDIQIKASPDNVEGEIWIIRKSVVNNPSLAIS